MGCSLRQAPLGSAVSSLCAVLVFDMNSLTAFVWVQVRILTLFQHEQIFWLLYIWFQESWAVEMHLTAAIESMQRWSCPCARHEGVWGSGGIVPLTPNLGIRWRCRQLYVFAVLPPGKEPSVLNSLAPNDIYIYIYIYKSYRTANLQSLHFKYLLNKYTHWIF